MSEKIKYTQKDLKKPDKFAERVLYVIEQIPNYYNIILYGIFILIISLVLVYIISVNREARTLEASKLFDESLQKYESGQILEALGSFSELREEYSGKKPAILATYYSGLISYDIGDYEASIELLDEYIRKGTGDELLRQSAIFTKGLAYFNLEKWEEAVSTLSRLEGVNSPYERKAMLHVGLALENTGEHEKAEEYFRDVLQQEQPAAANGLSIERVQ